MLRAMLRNVFHKNEDEGFTLIELLVVILIIGILAAIALPSFLGQSDKAKDASAKSDARNMVSQVESCYTTTTDYTLCLTDATGTAPGANSQLDLGGITAVVTSVAGGYKVDATSKTKNHFIIQKDATGVTRSCTTTGGSTKGGCSGSSW